MACKMRRVRAGKKRARKTVWVKGHRRSRPKRIRCR